MTEYLFGLGVVLGMLSTAWLLSALWISDRKRLDARVDDLLTLLEARAAPSEYAGYVHAPDTTPLPTYLFSDDGLIGVPLAPEDDD